MVGLIAVLRPIGWQGLLAYAPFHNLVRTFNDCVTYFAQRCHERVQGFAVQICESTVWGWTCEVAVSDCGLDRNHTIQEK